MLAGKAQQQLPQTAGRSSTVVDLAAIGRTDEPINERRAEHWPVLLGSPVGPRGRRGATETRVQPLTPVFMVREPVTMAPFAEDLRLGHLTDFRPVRILRYKWRFRILHSRGYIDLVL